MARSDMRVRVAAVGLDQSMEEGYNRGARRIARRPVRMTMDSRGFEQPLGRITGKVGEFQKSMDASVARVMAFGAAVGVINGVQKAFAALVKESIAVEKALVDINVLLQLSSDNLTRFGSDLFAVARNTAQGFDAIATAATEFARQGLTAEETLKRVNDAMILTRLSGLAAANSVNVLTAAVNSFTNEAIKTTDVVNRLANVDAAFAVSSKDLADSMARAGAAAMSAGVQFNELLAITTAVQQRTARGGAVIGNAFKTIFTRLQRSSVREVMEGIGIATTNMDGSFRSSAGVLRDYARVYQTLTDAQRAYTSEQVAGVRQVNILKSLIADMGNKYSIFNRALGTANNTTDEAIRRNAELNKTMAALAQQTALSVQELAASLGKLTMNEGVQRILGIIKSLSDGLNKILDPESGSGLMQGFFRGIGAFIAGPGLVLIGGAFLKIFKIVGKLGLDAGRTLFGLNKEAERQKNLQLAITSVLQKEEQVMQRLLAVAGNQAKQERIILDIIRQETAERAKQQRFVTGLARLPGLRGITAGEQGFKATTPAAAARIAPRAAGHIPQQSISSITERARATEGGYKAGRTVAMTLPSSGKPIVYNMAESLKYLPGFKDPFINPPKGKGTAWRKHQQRSIDTVGIDPYAGGGFVPNLSRRWSTGDAEATLTRWIKTFREHHGAFVGGGADSIRDLMRLDPNFTQTDRVKANDIYTYLKTRPEVPASNARRLAFLLGHQGTGAQSSKYKSKDPGWGSDPKTVKLINEFLETYDIAAEPGRLKKEEMVARMVAREKAPLPRPGLQIKVGKKPSLFATMGVSAFRNEVTMRALQRTKPLAADVLEARWGNKAERAQMGGIPGDSSIIHPKTKVKLSSRVDVARTQVSKAEFDEEVRKVLPRDPKTGQPLPLNRAALGQLGAKLFPITPGRVDSMAQQDFSKRASTIITSHANKKHIWQKEHSKKMEGGGLNRQVGPKGKAPSFARSEEFLQKKGKILFGKDKTAREKGQARGWIFDQISNFAMGALTGAGRTEVMAMDRATWDMPSKLHARYQDYYNTTATFGDYKAGVKSASASFIGKHIRRPLGAAGFIPSLAPPALKYRELEKYARDGSPGLTGKIAKSVREGAITENQGTAILAKTATAKGKTRESEKEREAGVKKRKQAKPRVDAKGLVTMLVPQRLGLTPGGAETQGHRIEFMMAGIDQAKPPNIKSATDLRLRRLSGSIAASAFPPSRASTPSTLTGDASAAAGIVWETAAKHAAKVGITASDNKRFDIGRAGDPLAAAAPNQALRTMFQGFTSGWADMKLNTGLQGEMAQKVYGAYETGLGPFKGLKKRKKKTGAAGGFIPKILRHQAAGLMPDFHAEGFIPNFFPAMRVPKFLEEMALKIKKAGGSAQVVGGAPRDHILGITPKDWDIEVFGLTQKRLQKLLKAEGGLSKDGLIGKDFGVFKTKHKGEEYEFTLPRRERKTGAGHKDFDITVDPTMSRKEAAQRRDLTLNSIGFDPLTKKFIDPLGGIQDLQAGIMRPTSHRFKEDPLRVLRSMQFAGRYGFTADKKLIEYSRGMVDEFGALPKERVRDEWQKWATKSSQPSKGLQFLEDSGWIKHFPEIQNLRGIPQNPKYHPEGDVFEHVKLVTDAMASNPKWQNLDEAARARLMYSALSHDFGKVTHTQITEAGITSRGHAEAGVPLVESFLERIMSKGEARKLSGRIKPYVKDHMFHGDWPNNVTDKSVRRLSGRVQDMEEFMILEEADLMGRGMSEHRRPWRQDFNKVERIVKEQGIAKAPPQSLVLGRHLIAGDLVAPGPQMGRILKELHTAQIDGKFKPNTLEGGLEYFKDNRQRIMGGTAAQGFIPNLAIKPRKRDVITDEHGYFGEQWKNYKVNKVSKDGTMHFDNTDRTLHQDQLNWRSHDHLKSRRQGKSYNWSTASVQRGTLDAMLVPQRWATIRQMQEFNHLEKLQTLQRAADRAMGRGHFPESMSLKASIQSRRAESGGPPHTEIVPVQDHHQGTRLQYIPDKKEWVYWGESTGGMHIPKEHEMILKQLTGEGLNIRQVKSDRLGNAELGFPSLQTAFKGDRPGHGTARHMQQRFREGYRPGWAGGFVPNLAGQPIKAYRGYSSADRRLTDIPNSLKSLWNPLLKSTTKDGFLAEVDKLVSGHVYGYQSMSYFTGSRGISKKEFPRAYDPGWVSKSNTEGFKTGGQGLRIVKGALEPGEVLHGTRIFKRARDIGEAAPSGFKSFSTDREVAEGYAKLSSSLSPGKGFNLSHGGGPMGRIEQVNVNQSRIFDKARISKYIDRFGLTRVKKTIAESLSNRGFLFGNKIEDIFLDVNRILRPGTMMGRENTHQLIQVLGEGFVPSFAEGSVPSLAPQSFQVGPRDWLQGSNIKRRQQLLEGRYVRPKMSPVGAARSRNAGITFPKEGALMNKWLAQRDGIYHALGNNAWSLTKSKFSRDPATSAVLQAPHVEHQIADLFQNAFITRPMMQDPYPWMKPFIRNVHPRNADSLQFYRRPDFGLKEYEQVRYKIGNKFEHVNLPREWYDRLQTMGLEHSQVKSIAGAYKSSVNEVLGNKDFTYGWSQKMWAASEARSMFPSRPFPQHRTIEQLPLADAMKMSDEAFMLTHKRTLSREYDTDVMTTMRNLTEHGSFRGQSNISHGIPGEAPMRIGADWKMHNLNAAELQKYKGKFGYGAGHIPSMAPVTGRKIIPFPQQSSQWIFRNVSGMKTGGKGLEKAYLEYFLNSGGKISSGDLGRLMQYGYTKKDLNKILQDFKADGGMIHGAQGFVPNFSGVSIQAQKGMQGLMGEKVKAAWNAEHSAGVPWGDIRLGTHPSIPSPGHLAVYDVKQGGIGGALGDHGGVQGAMRDSSAARSKAGGFIPSFADNPWGLRPHGTVRDPETNKIIKHTAAIEQGTRAINTQLSLYRQGTISLDQFHANVRQLTTDFKITSSSLSNVQRALAGQISSIDRERAAASARGQALGQEGNEAKKAMRAQQMMMAAFVLPMATGFLPQPGGRGGAGVMALGFTHGAGQAGGIGAMLAMSGTTPGMVAGGGCYHSRGCYRYVKGYGKKP